MKPVKSDLKSIESLRPLKTFEIVLGENLFTEEWVCEVQMDWLGTYYVYDDGREFHTHHLEFRLEEGGALSETGYRSAFYSGSVEDNQILEMVKDCVKGIIEEKMKTEITILSIDEKEKSYAESKNDS